MGVPQSAVSTPSKFEHVVKLVLSIAGVTAGAILAVVAPSYVQPVAGVIAAIGGLFGINELSAHVKSYSNPR